MKNERGPFHSILVDHFGLTMAVVIALCVLGALASVDTRPKDGDGAGNRPPLTSQEQDNG